MWRKLRRRTMAPRRPAVFPRQIPLVVLVGVVLVASLALVAYVVAGC